MKCYNCDRDPERTGALIALPSGVKVCARCKLDLEPPSDVIGIAVQATKASMTAKLEAASEALVEDVTRTASDGTVLHYEKWLKTPNDHTGNCMLCGLANRGARIAHPACYNAATAPAVMLAQKLAASR